MALHTKNFGDSSGQCGLAMVNVTDGSNVNMGLVSFELDVYKRQV